MSATKPRIFISSTIYDFRDLRSALKYWLEGLGYEVMLSEYNDFEKPLDKDTYNACLQAVHRANYYILLIGSRVGALYDSSNKISVTRMEYRRAYDLAKSAKMKVLIFVREDLWKIREDRRALQDFLLNDSKFSYEISDSDVNAIANHRSSAVNDAEAIFDFLDEVSRTQEMKQATAGQGEFPVGNWVHKFSTFQDILEQL